MEKQFICLSHDLNDFGIGNTLESSFKDFKENTRYDSIDIDELEFYECKKLNVEQKLIIKE